MLSGMTQSRAMTTKSLITKHTTLNNTHTTASILRQFHAKPNLGLGSIVFQMLLFLKQKSSASFLNCCYNINNLVQDRACETAFSPKNAESIMCFSKCWLLQSNLIRSCRRKTGGEIDKEICHNELSEDKLWVWVFMTVLLALWYIYGKNLSGMFW